MSICCDLSQFHLSLKSCPFMEGETISHTYTNPGTYTIKVVAITGGVATTEYTQNVTVTIPVIIGLPLDFESATLPYSFTNFGGASTVVANNTNSGGINSSAKVGEAPFKFFFVY